GVDAAADRDSHHRRRGEPFDALMYPRAVLPLARRARARAARFAVSLALAATAHASLAGSILLASSATWAADQKASPAAQKLLDQAKKAFDDASYDESLQLF